MIPARHIWLSCLIMLLFGCSADEERHHVAEPSCAIALGYMKKFQAEAGRPIAVVASPDGTAPSRDEIAAFLYHQPRLRGHSDIEQALAEAKLRAVSVVRSCPQVQTWLSAEKVLSDDGTIKGLTQAEEWPIAVLSVTVPVITKGGNRATFYASRYFGPLAGETVAVRYCRDAHGRWRFVGETTVSVS